MGYLRFVVGSGRDRPTHLNGVLSGAQQLQEAGCFTACEEDRLEELFDWYNRHLPVPPYRRMRLSDRGVCWFKDRASSMIDRAWDLAWLLRSADVPVRVLHTHKPGMVLYEDAYQVVAQARRF